MEEFENIFEHLPRYRIIICKQCKFAPVPGQLKTHLAKHHPCITPNHRRIICEKVLSLPDLALDVLDVVYPKPRNAPIAQLPIYYDGLACKARVDGVQCNYVCRTIRGIQEHCSEEHRWVNQQKRGGNVRTKQAHSVNKLWDCNRACQRFFKVGKWQRYFQVQTRTAPSTSVPSSQRDSFFRQQEQNIQQAKQEAAEKANRVHGFDGHKSEVVPWLRTTGIARHINGLRKDEIRAAIALPVASEECVLYTILDEAQKLFKEAHEWCFDGSNCKLSWPCRVTLSRFQSSLAESIGGTRAFDHYKEPSTLKIYFGMAKKFLAYFDRVAIQEGYHFSSGDLGEGVLRPEDVIVLTAEQQTTWHSIRTIAQRRNVSDGDSNKERSDEEEDDGLKEQLLQMWMLLICHDTGARRYSSPLLSFCAMLSIRTSGSWMDPGVFNSHLSAIIWVVQLLIFYDGARREDNGEGPTIRHVKRCCEKYLQQTNETPMGEILRWRLLLFRVSKDEILTRQATWDESEQILTYDGTELHMDQIPTLLASEYKDCQRMLYQDLMFGATDYPHMHARELKDIADVQVVDWNFTQHADNQRLLQGSEHALLSTIEQSPRLCRTFLTEDENTSKGLSWRESAVASYEATVQTYLERLSVLIHISAGAPTRESEFMSMTWKNTQRPRSITLRHGRVMIHLTYHKGQQQSGKYRDNIRFLAHPIADLLLDYLVYVTPLRQVFLKHMSPSRLLSPFIWEKNGTVWPEGKLGRCLEASCTRAQIPRLHIANWRQMTVAIVKTKFASDISCFEMDPNDEDAEEPDENVRALTKQRNHKVRTANRAYANQTGATFGNVWDGLIRTGLRASDLWQEFWGVDLILASGKRPLSDEDSRMVKRVAQGIYKPRKPWSREALLEGLRRMYANNAMQWSSTEQEQALTTIMSWIEQVVVVLPTGAGKSALVMVPCILPDASVTVFVVPLVSLRGDLVRRVQELGIDYLEWSDRERREARLVFVSAEAAGSKDFFRYARALVDRQKLDRIIIDECHLTVTAAGYRPSIVNLTNIRSLRTQFVYLTATLPPSLQHEFEERNYLLRPSIIRASSNRPNLFYMVRKAIHGKGSLLQQAAAELQDAWQESSLFDRLRDKIIAYVRTRDDAQELSTLLSCSYYTSDCGTAEERKGVLAEWISSPDRPYIVATTALAEGFDYPYVRFVMNVNEPDSLVIFAQESGRAGRDGQRAYSLVLLPATWQPQDGTTQRLDIPASSAKDIDLRKQWDRKAVHRYLRGEQCYRTSLSEYLDIPLHRRWCTGVDVACDVCKVNHTEAIAIEEPRKQEWRHTGLDVIQQRRLAEQQELTQYREDLVAARGVCMFCRAKDQQWDHEFRHCLGRFKVFEERNRARERQKAKGRQWLQPYTACFWCLNPQAICARAEHISEQAGHGCEFGDVVLPLCCGLFESNSGRGWIQEHFRRGFSQVGDFMDWIGEESGFGGERSIQGVRVAAKKLGEFHWVF